jgi:hypothetical protein
MEGPQPRRRGRGLTVVVVAVLASGFVTGGCDFRFSRLPDVQLPLLEVNTRSWELGYVQAKGTWTLEGDSMGWPLQTTTIECHRTRRVCLAATAIYDFGETKMFTVDLETFPIQRWDAREIRTELVRNALCVSTTLSLSRDELSVTGVSRRHPGGRLCGDEGSDRVVRLVSGVDALQRLRSNR